MSYTERYKIALRSLKLLEKLTSLEVTGRTLHEHRKYLPDFSGPVEPFRLADFVPPTSSGHKTSAMGSKEEEESPYNSRAIDRQTELYLRYSKTFQQREWRKFNEWK